MKILGITLENVPKWDIHFEEMIGRAAGKMYILRVCKYYGMSINQLNLLYNKDNALQELLPNKLNRPLRQRGHEFELPIIRTERYKRFFINRCLYKFV